MNKTFQPFSAQPLSNGRPAHAAQPLGLTLGLVATVVLGGCSTVGDLLGTSSGGQPIDYRSQAAKTQPLEVPPDLTQLAREGRFTVQGGAGSVSASTFGQPTVGAPAAATGPAVVPQEVGQVRMVRDGQLRRLVTTLPPEVVYQRALAFWKDAGFTVEIERPEAGVIETGWAENRAKLPQDFLRSMLGRLGDGVFSTGERDRFRTTIERATQGTEITIIHRGLIEGPVGNDKERIVWSPRPSDPTLEGEMSYRLMAKLGAPEAQVQQARAAEGASASAAGRGPATAAAQGPAMARLLGDGRIEISEGFDRAWRRLGAGLDRAGFTVEDRDRAGGTYFVRFVDRTAQQANSGFMDRIFDVFRSDDSKTRLARYRIVLKAEGDSRSVATVLNSNGQPEASNALVKQMLELLVKELR